MNKFKKIIKYLIPPIFNIGILNEIFNKIFYRKDVNYIYHFDKFYKRHAFINKAISKFIDCKYLEIGVSNNDVFNSIPLQLENKFGVDPNKGGNFRMTSDQFFQRNPDLKFDVIFIDGLHEYEQCQKDCINSINQLNSSGIIIFHDFLPRSNFEQKVPRKQSSWSGDVWKVAVELINSEGVEFRIVNVDMGVGILKIKPGFKYKKINELKNQNFDDYIKHRKTFPIINPLEGLKFIDSK
ncbi:class I SAM-dependent methyltransferase [Candidatus Pelagibacter sp.]|nr:class I SAM-dependent methyltransferase [Candidatus Pelagibacter sp.]